MEKEKRPFTLRPPLDLGGLGIVIKAELVMPDVFDTVIEDRETGLAMEAFIVSQNAENISAAAKRYGMTDPEYTELLVYREDSTGNTRYIIEYELFRYRVRNHLPTPDGEDIRTLAAIGAELYPEYFGRYPVPCLTPWGCTIRHKVLSSGLFWLETEQFQQGLAVAFPKYDDLSDGARGLAECGGDGPASTDGQIPAYLFFREHDSAVPLFELIIMVGKPELCRMIDRTALMNAIYLYHPEYAAQHNLAEQMGQNDGAGRFLQAQGFDLEPKSAPERFIAMSGGKGAQFIDF